MKIKQIMPAENYWGRFEFENNEIKYEKIVAFALIYDQSIREKEDRYSVVPMQHYGDFEFGDMSASDRTMANFTVIYSTDNLSMTVL